VGRKKEVGWYVGGILLYMSRCKHSEDSGRIKERTTFRYLLLTSVNAERSFSKFRLLLGDKANEFE
jgi:hypothetical protein